MAFGSWGKKMVNSVKNAFTGGSTSNLSLPQNNNGISSKPAVVKPGDIDIRKLDLSKCTLK